MAETIFITGASSGIGKVTAKLFHDKGWNVAATMRNPEKETELTTLETVLVSRLDVTDEASISAAVDAATARFGSIEVLMNNAGYGAYGPLEAFPMDAIRRQFDTNVIGLLAVTKAVLPHMRARGGGMVVNISSIGGQMTMPLGTLYNGTKFAVEGLSEALHFELAAAGIRMKIIEPGVIATDFGGRSLDFRNDEALTAYQPVVQAMMRFRDSGDRQESDPAVVAGVIWEAVTDGTDTLRYRAGPDAIELLDTRKATDDASFIAGIKTRFGLWT